MRRTRNVNTYYILLAFNVSCCNKNKSKFIKPKYCSLCVEVELELASIANLRLIYQILLKHIINSVSFPFLPFVLSNFIDLSSIHT